jgi:heme/copper-type cytochrome/quinol oxidase subunit 3
MNLTGLTRRRWLLGTLLIAGAALFAIGIAAEGDRHHEPATTFESGEHSEATEQSEHRPTEAAEAGSETVLGMNLESAPLVTLAVIISVALAAATWRTDHTLILLVTALFAAAFVVLDVAEFSHQLRRSAVAVAAIAATVAILHAAAAFLAEQRRTTAT